MSRVSIVVSGAGAVVALFAAADAFLGVGAVDWIVDLCLTGPDEPATMPMLPMKHGENALPLLATGLALGSVSCLLAARRPAAAGPEAGAARSDEQVRLLAVLGMMAGSSDRIGPEAIAEAYGRSFDGDLSPEEADAVHAMHCAETLEEDLPLFAGIRDRAERGALVCAALEFAERNPDAEKTTRVVAAIADTMQMDVPEIVEFWSARQDEPVGEALGSRVAGLWQGVRGVADRAAAFVSKQRDVTSRTYAATEEILQ